MHHRNVTVTLSVASTSGAECPGDEAWRAVARAIEDTLAGFSYQEADTGLAFESKSATANLHPETVDFGTFGQYGAYAYGDIR